MDVPEQTSLAFVPGSDTSQAAADSMIRHFGKQQKRLYVWSLLQLAGFTDEQAANALKMNPSSLRPRRGELVSGGILKDSGERRQTSSGRSAVVWVVA